jgi:hypothetical protein
MILIHNRMHSIKIRIIKSRRMRWAGNIARMAEKRNAYRILVGKPEGTRPLGRPRCKWVDNIVTYGPIARQWRNNRTFIARQLNNNGQAGTMLIPNRDVLV